MLIKGNTVLIKNASSSTTHKKTVKLISLYLSSTFIYEPILINIYMNANFVNMQLFHLYKYELKGH